MVQWMASTRPKESRRAARQDYRQMKRLSWGAKAGMGGAASVYLCMFLWGRKATRKKSSFSCVCVVVSLSFAFS